MREFFELNAALQVLISATIRNEQTFEAFLKACGGSFTSRETRHYDMADVLLTLVG
jgi:hypothetical protein